MKKIYLLLSFLVFCICEAQNPAEVDPSFNQFYSPLGNYFVQSKVYKTVVDTNDKLYLLVTNIEDGVSLTAPKREIVKLNNNIFENNILFDNGSILDFKVQSDGKILVYGTFTSYDSQPVKNVVRFNPDFTLDSSFDLDSSITITFTYGINVGNGLFVQSDDKIIIVGGINCVQGTKSFIRINEDGSFDNSFNSAVVEQVAHTVAMQNDNKLLVGSYLTHGGTPVRVYRLNLDGSIDDSFNLGSGANGFLNKILVLQNGKIIALGGFSSYNGVFVRNGIVKLNQDGSLDSSFNDTSSQGVFNRGFYIYPYANVTSRVQDIIEQPDGKLIAVGSFNSYDNGTPNSTNCQNIVRIEGNNGAIDPTFIATIDYDYTNYTSPTPIGIMDNFTNSSLVFDSQNRLYIGGKFSKYNNQRVNNIVRVGLDTNIDNTFNNFCKGFDDPVSIIREFNDGKILCFGSFKRYNGIESTYLIKLNQDGSIDTSFTSYFGEIALSVLDNIYDILIQDDGKVLLVGRRSSSSTTYQNILRYSGVEFKGILRLNQNGTIDTTFNYGNGIESGTTSDCRLEYIVQQSDGKILVSTQDAKRYKGILVERGVFRILQNGDLDLSFQFPYTAYGGKLFLDSNEKVLVNSAVSNYFFKRYNNDGSLDSSFPTINAYLIGIQSDGKIMALEGGNNTQNTVKRYSSDGIIDNTYQPYLTPNSGPIKQSFNLLPDDKIVFCNVIDSNNAKILKLEANGILDNAFDIPVGIDSYGTYSPVIYANRITVFPMSSGKIMVGLRSGFHKYNNIEHWNVLRLLGNSYFKISGTNLLDFGMDGCDFNDLRYGQLNFAISNGLNYFANKSGDYNIYFEDEGVYNLIPSLENPSYFNVAPSSISVTFPGDSSPFIQNFCITPNGNHPDLEISILPLTPARPGFDTKYKLFYKNKGNQLQSGSFSLTFNDNVLDLVSSVPLQNTISGNMLSWNFTDLSPMESREVMVVFNANTPTESPALNANDVISFTANITSALVDEIPIDNIFNLNQTVVNSYDPNDKTCLQGKTVSSEVIGEYVHYLIRFENTGSYNAQNITVTDYIDTSKFDISTLVPLTGSHLFVTKISEGNKVEFYFENINLPFQNATNDGFVAFKIKTKPNLTVGDSFSNSANIYFDYNSAIITNEYVSTIQALSSEDFDFKNYFTVYPNPVDNILNISRNNNNIIINNIAIYNVLGQLVISIPNAKSVENIDVSKLSEGQYFIVIKTDKGISNTKFIKN